MRRRVGRICNPSYGNLGFGEFHGVLQWRPEAAQTSVTGEPAERLKAAIDAMRTHSRDFEERIRATKGEEKKDPLEMSDRRAPGRLRDLAGRLLRQFRKRGGNGAEGGFVPGVFAEIK